MHNHPMDPDRRTSASSASDMQVDHDVRYSIDAAAAAIVSSAMHPASRHADALGLTHPPASSAVVTATAHSDHSNAASDNAHGLPGTLQPPPEAAGSGSLPPPPAPPALQAMPANSCQSAEDIHMSESPDLGAGDEAYHRPADRASESESPLPGMPQDDDDEDDDDEDVDDADGSKRHDGVTMPAKSALLYHAGYNSGRGAVWRFFRVVEARVSGNTDRAECLLCNKRMLGKSADMKKHIVQNCPSRAEISEDMRPILAIVKAELENPKKRAKRNSTTPITLQVDGTFAPVASQYPGAHVDHSPAGGTAPARTFAGPVRKTPPLRTPPHQHASPYEVPHHHRAKVAKYSR
ncbi:hypothetical protein H4R21_002376 [Coemansia helicoidea]|uniref:Uncharacterized protein n=1 Tax=Coemansia helicoidea TaxID=1286919 RepID=A0ACC1L760_9FUNG|nr:hypothetical protein H4R21_002376 [Coemansia helicoidea]